MASPLEPSEATERPGADRARELRERAFAEKDAWHRAEAAKSPVEKVAILLQLQREVLPILRARRPLAPHERPWPIRP
jgi:hypothetical protein